MRVAIVGAGLAGLALSYELSRRGGEVLLYDPAGLGGGASGVSPGLLHSYAGKHARKSPRADEGMEATRALLEIAGSPIRSRGILRIATSEEQANDFRKTASHPDVEQRGSDIYISSGLTVDVPAYLEGLYRASNATLIEEKVSDLNALDADEVVVTAGAATGALLDIDVKMIKGQVVKLAWPESLPPPPCSVIAEKYLVMVDEGKACWVGATFEREFTSAEVDEEIAIATLVPAIARTYPELARSEVLEVRAGLRVKPPIIAKEISPHRWAFTGLGSKGLLYHALVARELAERLKK